MIEANTATAISTLPALADDERDDAEFRGLDRAWAELVRVYEDRRETDPGLNYETLGRRIRRSRKQVQRWLSSSMNMTLKSFGLLAEGLDAEMKIVLEPRREPDQASNYCHPSEEVKYYIRPGGIIPGGRVAGPIPLISGSFATVTSYANG